MLWLLAACVGCGPAVHAPPVPDWRRELEGLQAQAVLDAALGPRGQARLAFLQDFSAGAPALADAPDRAVGDPAALRALAFRAVERRAPGWASAVRAAVQAAPEDPGTLGLALCARRAGLALPEPTDLAAAQAALASRVERDPRAWRALWWVAQARGVDPQAVAGAWATHWPRHAPAWAAVGAGELRWGPRVAALTRAADGGHVQAAQALVVALDAGGRASAAEAWRDRLRRQGVSGPVPASPREAPARPRPTPPPATVRDAAAALPAHVPGERWRIWVDGWLIDRGPHGARRVTPAPERDALAFDGPSPASRAVLVVVRDRAPVPLDGPTPQATTWAGRAAWRAERAPVAVAPAGVPEAWREGVGLSTAARAARPPASNWRIEGELDLRRAQFRVRIAVGGPAQVRFAALAGAPTRLAAALAQTLPVAGLSQVRWTGGAAEVRGQLHGDAPGPWLARPLALALSGASWPAGVEDAEVAVALPSLGMTARWAIRGGPAHWRGARGWFNVEAAGPWGAIRQAAVEGDEAGQVTLERRVEFLQPALLAGDAHGRAALREAAGRWAPATLPVGGE